MWISTPNKRQKPEPPPPPFALDLENTGSGWLDVGLIVTLLVLLVSVVLVVIFA